MTLVDADPPLTKTQETRFALDPEHGGLRLVMLLGFLAVWALVFLAGQALLAMEAAVIISLVAGFAVAALAARRSEGWLRQRWPSGRSVAVADRQILLRRRDREEETLASDQEVNVLTWCFRISRRSRVPKGWYMVACALEQDERYIPVYAFFSPGDFEELTNRRYFTELQGRKQRRQGGDLRLAGEQKRLHAAEQLRWMQGGEMSREDFTAFLRFLHERFPAWMPELV